MNNPLYMMNQTYRSYINKLNDLSDINHKLFVKLSIKQNKTINSKNKITIRKCSCAKIDEERTYTYDLWEFRCINDMYHRECSESHECFTCHRCHTEEEWMFDSNCYDSKYKKWICGDCLNDIHCLAKFTNDHSVRILVDEDLLKANIHMIHDYNSPCTNIYTCQLCNIKNKILNDKKIFKTVLKNKKQTNFDFSFKTYDVSTDYSVLLG